MQILKMGVPLFKLASCMYCVTFFQYIHCQAVNLKMQKRVVMSFYVLKKINEIRVAGLNFWLAYNIFVGHRQTLKNQIRRQISFNFWIKIKNTTKQPQN